MVANDYINFLFEGTFCYSEDFVTRISTFVANQFERADTRKGEQYLRIKTYVWKTYYKRFEQ